jgi:hypothetical protein
MVHCRPRCIEYCHHNNNMFPLAQAPAPQTFLPFPDPRTKGGFLGWRQVLSDAPTDLPERRLLLLTNGKGKKKEGIHNTCI